MEKDPIIERDQYVDFLRAFGLLLLVVAHTSPPEWLAAVRTFDVPLMVFISSICYKPIGGAYLNYCFKRFKRIYLPVFIFLTLFFTADIIYSLYVGKPNIGFDTIIGSYLMLNYPSIGYVWIMRVFLMMALLIPFLNRFLIKHGFITTISITILLIICQQFAVMFVTSIENKIVRFILDETILYALGYSTIAIIGLKIKSFKVREITFLICICAIALIAIIGYNNWKFDPQAFKYPPQSLYLFYGILISSVLWLFKPLLSQFVKIRFFTYLSTNSMWIYLWHIIPVILIQPLSGIPNMWFCRFCIVIITSLLLSYIYLNTIKLLPQRTFTLLK